MTKKTDAGKELLAMLTAKNVRKAQLARDLGVTSTSIGRWFMELDDGTIADHAWTRLGGLLASKYGIDAAKLRPLPKAASVQAPSLDTSLVPHLDAFTTKEELTFLVRQLERPEKAVFVALKHIMERASTDQARDLVLVIARDRLARLE